jgi:hypothetical protein
VEENLTFAATIDYTMADHNDLGKWGEEQAAVYLQQAGYIILDRDWQLR